MNSDVISKMIEVSDKRYAVMRLRRNCPRCLSEQVQLTSWLINTSWKCRHCKHTFGEKMK